MTESAQRRGIAPMSSIVGSDPGTARQQFGDSSIYVGAWMSPKRQQGSSDSRGAERLDITMSEEMLVRVSRSLKRVPLQILADDPRLVHSPLFMPSNHAFEVAKRLSDVLASFLLALLIVPLLPWIAIAIRLDSSGPIFYSQTRVGRDGKHFRIHKLRTMDRDAEKDGAVYAEKDDPRVTRVGKFLRRSRIDEIPQLWNILRGEMSLIGPRPERPENLAMLEANLPGFMIRMKVKPGITGWAQVSVPYAGTIEQTGAKLEYDLYYVMNASISFDTKIFVRTIAVVLGRRGQ